MKLSKYFMSINAELIGGSFLYRNPALQEFHAPRLRRAGSFAAYDPKRGDLSTALILNPNRDKLLNND